MKRNIVAAHELMARSRAERFAVGAFNVDNQETLLAIVRAAQAKNAPVLVELSHSEAQVIGLANTRSLVDNYRREFGIEMYVNPDHSPSVEAAKAGIDAGFEFVRIDYSQAKKDATDAEIIAATRAVVEYAGQTTQALIESEPHYFAGSSNVHKEPIDYEKIRATFSTPEGAHAFVEATGIDTFAAAIGNLHGRYPVARHRVARADQGGGRREHQPSRRQRDAGPLLQGGGSRGRQQDQSQFRPAVRVPHHPGAPARRNPDEYAIVRLIGPVIDAVQKVVEEHIDLFGSTGKARAGS